MKDDIEVFFLSSWVNDILETFYISLTLLCCHYRSIGEKKELKKLIQLVLQEVMEKM